MIHIKLPDTVSTDDSITGHDIPGIQLDCQWPIWPFIENLSLQVPQFAVCISACQTLHCAAPLCSSSLACSSYLYTQLACLNSHLVLWISEGAVQATYRSSRRRNQSTFLPITQRQVTAAAGPPFTKPSSPSDTITPSKIWRRRENRQGLL